MAINVSGVLDGMVVVLPTFTAQKSGQVIATSVGMHTLYEAHGIAPGRIANVVAFAVEQLADTHVTELTVGRTTQLR